MTKKEVKTMSDEFDEFIGAVKKNKEWATKVAAAEEDGDEDEYYSAAEYSLACRILNELETVKQT